YTFMIGRVDTGDMEISTLAPLWIPVSDIFGMKLDKPVNAGPQHYLRNAAFSHLERWVSDGSRPPSSVPLETDQEGLVTDELGIAMGGIRTPHVDVPTSVLSGTGNRGQDVAFLAGTTTPLDRNRLIEMYASKDEYMQRFASATEDAVSNGYFLVEDAKEIDSVAAFNSPL
ncbi:MAG: alpha/beta hydrolase domain-containing protein, partial [Acidimicrobiales bacterium]